ncbi:MAG: glycosyltransferase [Bacteroidota bacterium]
MIDIGNAPPNTGIRIQSDGLIQALRRYGRGRVRVCESPASSPSKQFRSIRRIKYLWNLKLLAAHGYQQMDVVHFTNVFVPKPQKRVMMIGAIYDLDAVNFPSTYSRSYRLYYRYIISRTIENAHKIITPTESVLELICERYPGVRNKIKALGVGLSENFIAAVRETPNESKTSIPTLLFVGTLSTKKNIHWLIPTVLKGVQSGALPRLKLVLAGNEGFGFPYFREQIYNSHGIVEWVKSPNIFDLVKLYKTSHVVLLPSLTEGFGIPLIEAMYCKTCIVASRIPTSLEVASRAAFYFDLNDDEEFFAAVKAGLEDNDKVQRENFIEGYIQKYLWETLAPQYIKTYEDLVCFRP